MELEAVPLATASHSDVGGRGAGSNQAGYKGFDAGGGGRSDADGCARFCGWFWRWCWARLKEFGSQLAALAPAPRELWVAYSLTIFESYSFFALSYVFVLYLSDEFGFSDTAAGLIYGFYGLVYAAFSLCVGVAVDKLGVRRSLLAGGVFLTSARLALAFCSGRGILYSVVFVLLPLGCAFGIPVLTLAVKRYTTESNRAVAYSLFFVTLNLGAFLAGVMVDAFRTAYPPPPQRMGETLSAGTAAVTDAAAAVAAGAAGALAALASAAQAAAGGSLDQAAAALRSAVEGAVSSAGNATQLAASAAARGFDGNSTVPLSTLAGLLQGNTTLEDLLQGVADKAAAVAIGAAGPVATWVVSVFDVTPGPLLSETRALVLSSAAATAFAFSIAALLLREITVDEKTGEAVESEQPRESPLALARQLVHSRRFWRFALLIALLTGVRSVIRHLDTTFPKYATREIGAGFPYGTVISLDPIISFEITFPPRFEPAPARVPRPARPPSAAPRPSPPHMIVCLVPLIGAFYHSRSTPFQSIVAGSFVTAAAPLFLVVGPYPATAVLFVVVLAAGEATWAPRLYEYAVSLAPPGREGVYASLAIFPLYGSKLLAGTVSGLLLDALCPAGGPRSSRGMWAAVAALSLACPALIALLRPVIERRDPGEDCRGGGDGPEPRPLARDEAEAEAETEAEAEAGGRGGPGAAEGRPKGPEEAAVPPGGGGVRSGGGGGGGGAAVEMRDMGGGGGGRGSGGGGDLERPGDTLTEFEPPGGGGVPPGPAAPGDDC
eukprot:tig00000767_g3950.t2